MIRRLLALPIVALITISTCPSAFSQQKDIEQLEFSDLIAQRQLPPPAPAARMPSPDALVTPAQENRFFPIRADGQPYVLSLDLSVNMTEALNHFYFDPRWRGETWGPFNQFYIVEKMTRMMPTYTEYDQFSTLRIMNGWHKFWEKYSGYGP
jgi:hypothetical protein